MCKLARQAFGRLFQALAHNPLLWSHGVLPLALLLHLLTEQVRRLRGLPVLMVMVRRLLRRHLLLQDAIHCRVSPQGLLQMAALLLQVAVGLLLLHLHLHRAQQALLLRVQVKLLCLAQIGWLLLGFPMLLEHQLRGLLLQRGSVAGHPLLVRGIHLPS